MKFTITCTDGVVLNGDTSLNQRFEIDQNGVLTFFDAPEDSLQSATTYSPWAWKSIRHTVRAKKSGRASKRTAYVLD